MSDEFRLFGRLKSAHKPLGRRMAVEHIVGRLAANLAYIQQRKSANGMEEYMSTYRCSKCNKVLEEIGIPPQIQMVQMFKHVVNIGSTEVPEEIKNDPYLYRGFFCPNCNKAFCPQCSHMQGEICPECGQRVLMPAYRPLLIKIAQTPAKSKKSRAKKIDEPSKERFFKADKLIKETEHFLLLEVEIPVPEYIMLLRQALVEQVSKSGVPFEQAATMIAGQLFTVSKGSATKEEIVRVGAQISQNSWVGRYPRASSAIAMKGLSSSWEVPVVVVAWQR